MNTTRKVLIGVGALVLVGAILSGAAIATRSSWSGDRGAEASTMSSTSRSGGSSTRGSTDSAMQDDAESGTSNGVGTLEGDGIDRVTDRIDAGTVTAGSAVDAPADAGVATTEPAGDGTSALPSDPSTPSDPSAPSPVGDRGVRGPITPPRIDTGVSLSDFGPTLSAPSASCGSKIIFSVTAQDMNGVSSVWGSYYVGGSKQSFSSSPTGGNVWSTTILHGSADPVTSLVVFAKDGLGNNASLAVGTLCA